MNNRITLWILVFMGFMITYMIRNSMNITIIAMIKNRAERRQSFSGSGPFKNESLNTVDGVCTLTSEQQTDKINQTDEDFRGFSFETFLLDSFHITYDKHGFDWNEQQQGYVLGSFFWLHWITQIPGGILARKYGTKLIFGISNFIGCLLCFLMPIVSYMDIKWLIGLRVLQGLISGLSWPSMHNMTAQWIPPNERSKFVTAYLGSSFGLSVFYPLFGLVISYSSWEWVYHLCGILGTCWFIAWQYYVYDTPAKHPRIDPIERQFIERALGKTVHNAEQTNENEKRTGIPATPWLKIIKSKPVWMNIIAQWGGIWGLFTLMTQAPTYFKIVHGWNMQMVGILSGLPHLSRMLFALGFSIYGDYLIRSEKMSRTNVRKLAGTMCCIVKGLIVLGLGYSGCSSVAAVVCLTLATTVHGAVSTGPLANMVDLSPNFSAIILGISGLITVLPGFISPIIVGRLTLNNQTIQQWQYVFFIAAFQLIVSGILYILFTDSNLQDWNEPQMMTTDTKAKTPTEKILIDGGDDDDDDDDDDNNADNVDNRSISITKRRSQIGDGENNEMESLVIK